MTILYNAISGFALGLVAAVVVVAIGFFLGIGLRVANDGERF